MGVSLYMNPEGVMHNFSLLGLSMAVKPSLDEIALVSELQMARRRAEEELLCNGLLFCLSPEHPCSPSVTLFQADDTSLMCALLPLLPLLHSPLLILSLWHFQMHFCAK